MPLEKELLIFHLNNILGTSKTGQIAKVENSEFI